MEVEIKEEPVFIEETANTSYSVADIKGELITEEHTIDQLVPYFKQENSAEKVAVLTTTHSGGRTHCCTECSMMFSRASNLKNHMLAHSTQMYQCTYCSSTFSSKSYLKRHMLIHVGLRPYYCNLCKNAFQDKSTLKRHMVVHTGERPYHCNLCDSTFTQSGNIRRHMLSHARERPYLCHECGSTFTRRSHLVNHMVSHAGDIRTFLKNVRKGLY